LGGLRSLIEALGKNYNRLKLTTRMPHSANPICLFERKQKSELLTVCIPTYKRHQDLALCLDKLASDYKESPFFDVLVVDNDSRDETRQVIKDRQLKLPSMSAYAWSVNTGVVNNTQQLSAFVKTDFMLWLSDDDHLLAGAIKKCLSMLPVFKEQNLYWIVSPIETFNPDGSVNWIVSPPFRESQMIPAFHSYYARYAWAFSRQIWRTDHLRVSQEKINANKFLANSGYWLIYPAVLAISASKAFFWNESLVWHVYGNPVYWEEFGQKNTTRDARLSLDFILAYLLGVFDLLKANFSVASIYLQINQFLRVAWFRGFYRPGRIVTINTRQCISLVVCQSILELRLVAMVVVFIIFLGYPFLVLRPYLNRLRVGLVQNFSPHI